jgi:uncharacterized protein (TIGR01244 family)
MKPLNKKPHMTYTPHLQNLSTNVSVTAQLEPADMAWAAAQGFRSVINNRPDFEGGDEQPTNAAMSAAAQAAGLSYAFLPVDPGFQTAEEIADFAKLLTTLPGPVLAFCRSGTRSGKLYRAGLSA